jgi:hypothetical protein
MESHDSTSEPQDQPHLGDSINIATRALHAKLNKQILQYLPLALPPHVNNPSVYLAGMLQIASIYLSFESCWEDILTTQKEQTITRTITEDRGLATPASETSSSNPSPIQNTPITTPESSQLSPEQNNRIQTCLQALRALHNPLLSRTTPLLTDLRALKATCRSNPPLKEKLALILTQPTIPPSPVLDTFLTRMQQSLTIATATASATGPDQGPARPHLLLAYAWLLYMALFAGGKVVRGMLEGVGPDFWEGKLQSQAWGFGPIREGDRSDRVGYRGGDEAGKGKGGDDDDDAQQAKLPLAFFRFDTAQDGEDVKEEFKREFEEAGKVLTAGEREEVVEEAKRIFEHLISLVAWLHETLGKDRAVSDLNSGLIRSWVDWVVARLGWTGRERRDLEVVGKRGSQPKKDRVGKVVRFEKNGLPGRAAEQGTQGLRLWLGAWSLVLGLVIIGSALGLVYA